MTTSPLKLIQDDPHVIAVLPGEDWHLPGVDYSAFHPESQSSVERTMKTLQGFVRAHYIIDTFWDHAERRVWLARMTAQYGAEVARWYNAQNCLRYGQVGKVTCSDSMLDLHILHPYKGPKKQGLVEAVARVTALDLGGRKVYDTKSPIEKVTYVMQVKRRVHDLLHWV